MNRIALSLALALGLAVGTAAPAALGADLRPSSPPSSSTPDWFDDAPEGGVSPLGDLEPDGGPIVAKGLRSYSEDRALADARARLERAVADWLAPDVPADWTPPAALIDALVLDRHVAPVPLEADRLGLAAAELLDLPEALCVAAIRAEFSAEHRAALLDAYGREVGARRLTLLGGLAGFVLCCLAILALYIRADEATRGYYTNRLRLLSVASAAAAGAALYRLVT